MNPMEKARAIQKRRKGSKLTREDVSVKTGDTRLGSESTFITMHDPTLAMLDPSREYRPETSRFTVMMMESPHGEMLDLSPQQGLTIQAQQARFGWDFTDMTFGGNMMLNPLAKLFPIGYPFVFPMFIPRPPDIVGPFKGLAKVLKDA